MARLEIVTSFCDGPCGGNKIADDEGDAWAMAPGDGPQKVVDLCGECSESLRMLYDKGTAPRRRHKAALAPILPDHYDSIEEWSAALEARRFPVGGPAPVGLTVRAAA